MGELSPVHWAIVIGVVVLLFGSRRLPEAARAVGQSLRILRAETGQLAVRDQGTEDGDALAERTGPAPGVDRARDGHGGVPRAGRGADHHGAAGDVPGR